jgi:hypothetical protein
VLPRSCRATARLTNTAPSPRRCAPAPIDRHDRRGSPECDVVKESNAAAAEHRGHRFRMTDARNRCLDDNAVERRESSRNVVPMAFDQLRHPLTISPITAPRTPLWFKATPWVGKSPAHDSPISRPSDGSTRERDDNTTCNTDALHLLRHVYVQSGAGLSQHQNKHEPTYGVALGRYVPNKRI